MLNWQREMEETPDFTSWWEHRGCSHRPLTRGHAPDLSPGPPLAPLPVMLSFLPQVQGLPTLKAQFKSCLFHKALPTTRPLGLSLIHKLQDCSPFTPRRMAWVGLHHTGHRHWASLYVKGGLLEAALSSTPNANTQKASLAVPQAAPPS